MENLTEYQVINNILDQLSKQTQERLATMHFNEQKEQSTILLNYISLRDLRKFLDIVFIDLLNDLEVIKNTHYLTK